MRLVDIYTEDARDAARPATQFLYELLKERDPSINISHREMPTFEEHVRFIDSRPYREWFIIFVPDRPVGMIYLSKQNEIGVFILKSEQGHGYGKYAVQMLMEKYPEERFLANIAPDNSRSIEMFEKLGFDLIQFTFRKDAP